ncbi:glutathione S-transferase [Anabrus simplex]|uniref:glutathione S-transferase n=1 Tax=Anabrus simplex TaxID=316456 RepID=UPI0034DD3F3F
MAPKYKLTYFNAKALAEPIRFLFAYGGLEFEDVRISTKDWPNHKSSFPYGKVPTLEVDGQIIDQSKAIGRYLAKKVGLMGKDDWEDLLIDSVVDTFNDFRLECAEYAYEPDPKIKAKKQEKLWKETIPFYMNKLDELAKENGGYLVCGKLTWADVYVAGMHETYILYSGQNFLEGRAHLKSVVDKVYAIPAIKAIIDKRPSNEEF